MAFQTYAYYVNHYTVNKNNGILSKFIEVLNNVHKIKIWTTICVFFGFVYLLSVCLTWTIYKHKIPLTSSNLCTNIYLWEKFPDFQVFIWAFLQFIYCHLKDPYG